MVKPYYIYGCSSYYIYGQILLHLWFVDLLHLWLRVITFMVSITFMVVITFIVFITFMGDTKAKRTLTVIRSKGLAVHYPFVIRSNA